MSRIKSINFCLIYYSLKTKASFVSDSEGILPLHRIPVCRGSRARPAHGLFGGEQRKQRERERERERERDWLLLWEHRKSIIFSHNSLILWWETYSKNLYKFILSSLFFVKFIIRKWMGIIVSSHVTRNQRLAKIECDRYMYQASERQRNMVETESIKNRRHHHHHPGKFPLERNNICISSLFV
jgi:hypothetical protein